MVALFRAALINNQPVEFDGAKFHGKEIRAIENLPSDRLKSSTIVYKASAKFCPTPDTLPPRCH